MPRTRTSDAPAGATPTARLRASWQRCEHFAVPADEVTAAFRGSPEADPLFVECGRTVLAGLRESLASEPVGIMLTDAAGVVIERFLDDDGLHRSLDRAHLAPGFSYAERDAGTNGLGLALVDRAPSLVRGDEHWVEALRAYTCAAAPVVHPATGELVGTVNLTTWSRAASGLLLALATSAATSTAALVLARGGRAPDGRPAPRVLPPRGEVHRVVPDTGTPGGDPCTSTPWRRAREALAGQLLGGRVVALVGGPGTGKTALLAGVRRRAGLRGTLLAARAPEGAAAGAWLAAWTPVLADPGACVVVSGCERLPAWAAAELADLLAGSRRTGEPQPFVLAAHDLDLLPAPLAALVDAVVEVAPLRERPEDVVPLAQHFARARRHREIPVSPAAARALRAASWPGGATQLRAAVRAAVARADVLDVQHLPADVLAQGRRPLSRLEALERDEIVRALAEPGTTVAGAAQRLGISRATVYRRIAAYGIDVPRA